MVNAAHNAPLPRTAGNAAMTDADTTATLLEAAAALRADLACTPLNAAVADWLDAEAVSFSMLDPFTVLISKTLEKFGAPKGELTLARKENGDLQIASSTIVGALAVAATILNEKDA
jgi:hypothetical protein